MLRPFNGSVKKSKKYRDGIVIQMTIWLFEKKLDLIQKITGTRLGVKAICDKCKHELRIVDLLDEMKKKEDHFSILCQKCQHRFVAMLDIFKQKERLVLPLWRPCQVLNKLDKYTNCLPEEIALESPAIYHSAIFHFGSLRNAFKNISIGYKNQKINSKWKDMVRPFLGQISDYAIADIVGIGTKYVAEYRQDNYIEPFSIEKLKNELQQKT